MKTNRKHFGIICKIMLCEKDAEVYNKNLCPEYAKDDYRDLMRSGMWPKRYGTGGNWEWGTPSDYLRGGRTKLLLYDRFEKAITVDVNVIPEEMYLEKCDCPPNTEVHFHFRNVMDSKSIKVLKRPIPREKIQKLHDFAHFNSRRDRSAYRLISKDDYEFLIS